jgi:hypothetical protein
MGIEWLKPAAFIGSIVYALIGVVVFWLCFIIIDKITPYNLWEEIVEKQNRALALVVAAMSLGISHHRGGGHSLPGGLPVASPVRRAGQRAARPRPVEIALLASVFVVAACGLVYELAAGALASYLLGDSVLQFSTIIGTYLFAMGVGSYLSRFFERQLPAHFLRIELLVALAGGALPACCFWPMPTCRGRSACCCTAWCWWWARWWGWRFRWSCASSSATWRSKTWCRRC